MTPDACAGDLEIPPREVRRMRDEQQEFLLLDCREPDEHRLARIEGAVLVPMNDLSWRLGELRRHEENPVIVYCHHGRRSLMAAQWLRQQGFPDVRSMSGGIDRWSREIDSAVPTY
jgi:adenylyltransferase/sulfurtransferase